MAFINEHREIRKGKGKVLGTELVYLNHQI